MCWQLAHRKGDIDLDFNMIECTDFYSERHYDGSDDDDDVLMDVPQLSPLFAAKQIGMLNRNDLINVDSDKMTEMGIADNDTARSLDSIDELDHHESCRVMPFDLTDREVHQANSILRTEIDCIDQL